MPRDPLIGRDAQRAAVRRLLTADDVGLVTLTGAGGVGKTRLALQVAADLAGAFADGVVFVALEAIVGPRTVATYLTRIYAKLAVRTRTAAVRAAREQHVM